MTMPATRKVDYAGLIVGVMLLLIAGAILWDMSRLQITSAYGVGPKAMSIVVAIGLALLAAGNVVIGLRGELPEREPADLRPILLILGGLAALIALIGFGLGFILATTTLFVATSAAFGRRALHVDLLIGLALSVVVYLMFAKVLALSLPVGPIERLF
jgi:putative tricarboxylic transport membrane protein